MDPGRLSTGRKLPLFSGKEGQKKMDGASEKDLGCCGYDELAHKPAMTTPIGFGNQRSRAQAQAMPETDATGRPKVMARAASELQEDVRGHERSGMMAVSAIGKSIFDGPRGSGNQLNEIPLSGQPRFVRPRVTAVMGQETPVKTATPRVAAILKRESLPQGVTRIEAGELAFALGVAIEKSALALVEGEQCFGLDSASLSTARGLHEGLVRFAETAPGDSRLEIDPQDIQKIDRILECGMFYDRLKEAENARTTAFMAGGLVIGAVVLILVSQ